MDYSTLDRLSRRFTVPHSDIEALEYTIRRFPWKQVVHTFDLTIARINQAGSYVLLCPLHQERTPSFQIWVNGSGRYHCHGCKSDGTMLEFVVYLSRTIFWDDVVRFFESSHFIPRSDHDPHQLWFPFVEQYEFPNQSDEEIIF